MCEALGSTDESVLERAAQCMQNLAQHGELQTNGRTLCAIDALARAAGSSSSSSRRSSNHARLLGTILRVAHTLLQPSGEVGSALPKCVAARAAHAMLHPSTG